MPTYTPYQQRIRECSAQTYRFLDEHKYALTEADIKAIIDGMEQFTDPLTVDLTVAVLKELEWEYKAQEAKP